MKTFEKLQEYMSIYIQLLPFCYEYGGHRLHKNMLPTFDYFIEHYDSDAYSLSKPHYIDITGSNISGLVSPKIGPYRYYNYWNNCKFYTSNNINGDHITEGVEIYIKDEKFIQKQYDMMMIYLYGEE